MRSILIIITLSILSISTNAQRGGRLGATYGVASTQMSNANDAAADAKILKALPTAGSQYGLELGYMWRYFGISLQVMRNHYGQNYLRDNYLPASTKLTYTRPSFVVNFNSNPAKTVRLCGYGGLGYGLLNKYRETAAYHNPATGVIRTEEYTKSSFTISDTNTVSGFLNDNIYYRSDATAFGALGAEIRIDQKWLCNFMVRVDYGLEKLENYERMKRTVVNGSQTITTDYEHWRYAPSKFERDFMYTGVRTGSSNFATGIYFGVKYILASKAVLDYEMDGY